MARVDFTLFAGIFTEIFPAVMAVAVKVAVEPSLRRFDSVALLDSTALSSKFSKASENFAVTSMEVEVVDAEVLDDVKATV